eukprot:TRINITY_DN1391_c0_g1_i1.p1 TRINITY_DN1391_c0_g1~~TRINITY_DN1391_c0_g1_i1.p1  ORF type:complete len:2151 (-),score=139.11 TRINITY_DN1391_c0_g1_i1:21-6473(-)
MIGGPEPLTEEVEKVVQDIIKLSDSNNDRKISLPEFRTCVTKCREILTFLASYSLISKDDLRPNFGKVSEFDVPECDSDLEMEAVFKGKSSTYKTEIGGNSEIPSKFPNTQEILQKAKYERKIKTAPYGYIPRTNDAEAPDANLTLDYVYGYRCDDTRNNVRYNKGGEIVYHSASIGIVLNQDTNTQKHFFEHTTEIVSLSVHPNMLYIATGDVGHFPLICVWDTTTMECLARISGLLTHAIAHLCFSSDGNYLAAAAADEYHCIAIYDWDKYTTTAKNVASKAKKNNSNGLVATGQSTAADVLFLLFNPPGEQLIVASVNELNFVIFSGGVIKLQKGECNTGEDKQALLCAAFVGTTLVAGTFSGDLLAWKGKKYNNRVPAHKGSVNAIWPRPNLAGIITGGNDGAIKIWDQCLNELKSISLAGVTGLSTIPKIRSVCENVEGKILIGTRSGDIIEIVKEKPEVLVPEVHVRSHYREKTLGLAVHPKKLEFATLSRDSLFAVWDIALKKQKYSTKVDIGGDALAYAKNGAMGAMGLLNGQLIIFDAETYATITIRKDTVDSITEVKFSPNCQLLAASTDTFIVLYTVPTFKVLKRLRAQSIITHFDFSEDSALIQANTDSKDLLYFSIETAKQYTGDTHDIIWETWTCPLGWPVQGVNASNFWETTIYALDCSLDQKVIAVGDKAGNVKLFKFPCPIEASSCSVFKGHSSMVANVKFSFDGNYLISIGGCDKTVLQWKYTYDGEGEAAGENIKVGKDVLVDEVVGFFPKASTAKESFKKSEEKERRQRLEEEILRSQPKELVTTRDSGLPDANIKIKYVHGYRAYDTRNNVKWTKNGCVLYHTAGLGVVLRPDNNAQTFFVQHERDIVSIAIHPNGMIAATGELVDEFELAEIYVWNIETKDILACLKGFHINAVRHLKFSPNGSKLLSIGDDKDHSFALYDWMSNKVIASAKVDRGEVTSCDFKSDSEFVTCGVKHIKFWTVTGYNLTCLRGLIEDFEPIASAVYAFPSKICVTGSITGKLTVWNGRNCTQVISAHTKEVFVLQAKNNLLFSGSADGLLITWDSTFNQLSVLDMHTIDGVDPCIRAVDINKTGWYIIGTKGSEIVLHQKDKTTVLMHGHYSGELWGLCVSPNGTKFATCGGDKTVRIWNLNTLVQTQEFPEDGWACDWSSNSNFIALATVNGKIYTLNPSDKLTIVDQLQSTFEASQWIEDIKISPNNQLIAFGAHMGVSPVEVMKVNEQGSDLQKLKVINIGLTSPLIHLDWDITSTYLVVNSEEFGLVYVNVPSGSVIESSLSSYIDWHTWTCVLGFPMKGILPQLKGRIDINAVCRSHSEKIVATGDDYSKIKLYKYPCLSETAPFKSYIGHSSKVSKLRFLNEDKYLVSIGCKDKTVIIWATELGTAEGEKEEPEIDISNLENVYDEIDTAAEIERIPNSVILEEEKKSKYIDMMTIHELIQGIKEPTGYVKPPINQSQAPKLGLRLRHIHGYRSRDCKNNIHYLKDGSVAYHAATVGMVLDKHTNAQKFFNQHRFAILAIAFHPDGIKAATGDCGEKPVIFVWDSTTCSQIARFQGQLEKGIRSLAYSPSGDYLAAIDMSDYHMIAIYDVNNAILLAISKIDPTLVLQVAFRTENDLITVGPSHFMFWQMSNKSLISRKGQFEGKNSVIGCVAAEKDLVLTGNVLGELYLWNDRKVISSKQIHTKPIDCITIAQQIILTGGRDAKVNILDKQFNLIMTIDMSDKAYGSISPGIRALSLDRMGKNLLVGTFGSEIYELNIEPSGKTVQKFTALVKGHCSPRKSMASEMWGLAIFPCGTKYATVSDDATLRIWNISDKRQEKLIPLVDDIKSKEIVLSELQNSAKARAIDVGPDGTLAAVGFKDGSVRIIDLITGFTKYSKVHFDSSVSVIRISPDANRVAIGCLGNIIQVFDFPTMDSPKLLKGHTGSITHLDWSEDSQVLHSNSTDNRLLFWNANTGKLIVKGEEIHRDEKWATWTCVYGWSVQGIVYELSTKFLTCMRSNNYYDHYQLLATGDESGLLRIYRYPCLKRGSAHLLGKGHSSPVSTVKFTQDDKHIITTGLKDGCVFQWEIYQQITFNIWFYQSFYFATVVNFHFRLIFLYCTSKRAFGCSITSLYIMVPSILFQADYQTNYMC